ncbi:ABC transporter substrate-binding protein [Nakamurella lactea]|uniref:ABC transporter substrate-binding protein n=1 Tax=Nakamurella lactea TaxID=459515 RepID=UPI00040B83F5|nr:ABC transporter substrate-binding protein [Nakamurella lactea]
MRTRKALIASVLAAAMTLAACSGSDSADDPTTTAPSSPAESAEQPADTGTGTAAGTETSTTGSPQDTAAPAPSGGTVTVGAAAGIPQLNPAIRTFAWEEVLFPLLWNGLSKTDKDGNVVPDLAESWTASDDQKTWTFALRDGVTFSNGKAFTADDVVKTFDYYLKKDTPTQEANKIATVTDVKAKDDHTVTFTLSAANALFPSAIVWIKMLDMDSISTIDKKPIGTGPFVVKEFVPNDHLYLARSDSYFGDPAPLDEIKIVTSSDSAAAASSLASGDIEVLSELPLSDVDQYADSPDVTVVLPASPSQWPSWEVDATSPPFNNVKARQALAYAVDREQILDAAYYGQGVVSPTNNPLSTGNPWFSADGLTDYSYNLDKAKQLFTEAGVKEGDTLTWWGIAGSNPEWATAGQILQASLKEIGINLKIENVDVSTWVDRFYPAGKSYPGLVVPNFQSTPLEPAYSINFLLKGRCECNWDNPDFEKAYAAAVAEPDADARKQKWAEVQKIVNEQVPVIVPLQSNVATAVANKVSGVWVESGGQLHLESAGLTVS